MALSSDTLGYTLLLLHDVAIFSYKAFHIYTSRAATESNSGIGSWEEEEEEDVCSFKVL